MVVDYIKRIIIVCALAVFIGILFIGSKHTFAEMKSNLDDELIHSFIWPTEGVITDTYGTRGGRHFGIDIAANEGTPIYAVDGGIVHRSFYSHSYGNVIFIEHETGLETVYAHMHERYVKAGDYVEEGEQIGTVGNTGRSTGAHLHFEVHIGNWNMQKSNSIDPLLILIDPSEVKRQEQLTEILANKINIVETTTDELLLTYNDTLNEVEEVNDTSVTETKIIVKRGDTLWGFSQQYDVSIESIKQWNQLQSDTIYVDQQLLIYIEDDNMNFANVKRANKSYF